MDPLHPNFADMKPTVLIDSQFKTDLLALSTPLGTKDEPPGDMSSGLLDLPNEILLSIFEQLDDELYTLARLSRRLHHLALPMYLARKGMSPFTGELILFDERSEEVLQALSIALFKPTLKCVNCTVNFDQPHDNILLNIRALTRLVQRLSVLEEVHLDIRVFGGVQSVEAQIRETECHQRMEEDCAQEFLALLDAVLGKGCGVLTACIVGWCSPATSNGLVSAIFEDSGVGLLPWLFCDNDYVCSWANTVHRVFSNWHPSRWTSPSATPSPLESLSLHCPVLLQVQYLPWTLRMLNQSSLSTLSLKYLDIYSDSWPIILPRITLRNLIHLSIDSCSIPYLDLTRFLRRHPHLKHLYLGRSVPAPPNDAQNAGKILEQLTHLSATPEYLQYFLSGDTLPRLHAVTAITRVRHCQQFDFDALNSSLLPVFRRLCQVQLALELSVESGFPDWMHHETPSSTSSPTSTHRNESMMPYISTLELRMGLYRIPSDVQAALPRWLKLFTGLKTVAFWTPSTDGPTEAADRRAFLFSLYKRCPGLENIGINGLVRDREGWLAEEAR